MAPHRKAKKKATTQKNNDIKLGAGVAPTINYEEVQTDEIEALRAIFMDDFVDVETKSAWNKTTDRHFKLTVRSLSDETSSVVLSVQLTATYPKSPPVLKVDGLGEYHERTQKRIRKILQDRPDELTGDVMIHVIASEIQEALEDAVQARRQGVLPSLEDVRARAEQAASRLARAAGEAEVHRRKQEEVEEQRLLNEMADEEIDRHKKRLMRTESETSKTVPVQQESSMFLLNKPAAIMIRHVRTKFTSLRVTETLARRRNEENFLAIPQGSAGQLPAVVLVKRLTVDMGNKAIVGLEGKLEIISNLRHANIENLLTFTIESLDTMHSVLLVYHEHSILGTLLDLFDLSAVLQVEKARHFIVQLLEALEYLHQNGVTHEHIRPSNVQICGVPAVPKLSNIGYASGVDDKEKLSTKWQVPESESGGELIRSRVDVWQFGVLVVQMILGLKITEEFKSPQAMLTGLDISDSFEDFLRKMLVYNTRKRTTAFDLLTSEFLRTKDQPLSTNTASLRSVRRLSTVTPTQRSRHDSTNALEYTSRYATDFTEMGRLGRGGFGEVVQARNKLDGGVYAIKKIKQTRQLLDQVVAEVMLLNRPNHPYVVRYFTAWIETDISDIRDDVSSAATETATPTRTTGVELAVSRASSGNSASGFAYQSKGGLDFVSSDGFPAIDFADDSEEEELERDVAGDDNSDIFERADILENDNFDNDRQLGPKLERESSDPRGLRSVLYIQMEYCEHRTLRDLIRNAMESDDAWRYMRQITEGLAHVHSHGIIHRDLKPDNIFIDRAGSPKIGDFGLAITSIYLGNPKSGNGSNLTAGVMARSVGTALYVAPELKSGSSASCTEKVDMYSLGIIFFEMSQHFSTGMERIAEIQEIRKDKYQLPVAFQPKREKEAQGRLIMSLISHNPSERPTSTELLRSDSLPVHIEDETLRRAFSGFPDPKNPHHQKTLSALFTPDSTLALRVREMVWDAKSPVSNSDATRLRLRNSARATIESIFRRHGAQEAQRPPMFPRSKYNTNINTFQLMDRSGNLLQLPYDLTVPYARQLAREHITTRCTYSFATSYRDAFTGGPPKTFEEVDFDIVGGASGLDPAFDEAEVMKVMDEIVSEFPAFSRAATVYLQLNNALILGIVLDHCHIPIARHPAVKEILSRLGFHQQDWVKTRSELRNYGIPDTSLNEMQKFDFRELPETGFERLKVLLESGDSPKHSDLETAFQKLSLVLSYAKKIGISRTIYLMPLAAVKASFYEDGVLFQCVVEGKSHRRVVAAGGRYDSMIKAQRPKDAQGPIQGAVGMALGMDLMVQYMMNANSMQAKGSTSMNPKDIAPRAKRYDVALLASGTDAIFEAGCKILASLWANDICAEVLEEGRIPSEEEYAFVVLVRHEASNYVKVTNLLNGTEENDVLISSLVHHLLHELRGRDNGKSRLAPPRRMPSENATVINGKFKVLMASHGSKKANKFQIITDARQTWTDKLDKVKDAPILAVETKDEILVLIQSTRLSDAESWRTAIQSVQLSDRQYVQNIQEILLSWRSEWQSRDGPQEVGIYNFRTQFCMSYDLGL